MAEHNRSHFKERSLAANHDRFFSIHLLNVPVAVLVDDDGLLRLLDLPAVAHAPRVHRDVQVLVSQAHAVGLHQHLEERNVLSELVVVLRSKKCTKLYVEYSKNRSVRRQFSAIRLE